MQYRQLNGRFIWHQLFMTYIYIKHHFVFGCLFTPSVVLAGVPFVQNNNKVRQYNFDGVTAMFSFSCMEESEVV